MQMFTICNIINTRNQQGQRGHQNRHQLSLSSCDLQKQLLATFTVHMSKYDWSLSLLPSPNQWEANIYILLKDPSAERIFTSRSGFVLLIPFKCQLLL